MNDTVGPEDVRAAAAVCREALSGVVDRDWSILADWNGHAAGHLNTLRVHRLNTRPNWHSPPKKAWKGSILVAEWIN